MGKTIVLVPHAPDASNGQSTISTYEKIEDSIKRIINIVKKYPEVKLIVAELEAVCLDINLISPKPDILPKAVADLTPLLFNLTMLINYP